MIQLIVNGKNKTVVDLNAACRYWVQRNKLSISSDAVARELLDISGQPSRNAAVRAYINRL